MKEQFAIIKDIQSIFFGNTNLIPDTHLILSNVGNLRARNLLLHRCNISMHRADLIVERKQSQLVQFTRVFEKLKEFPMTVFSNYFISKRK